VQLIVGPDSITSYRRLDYSPWHAIAEFVDNSTQSYFDNRVTLDDAMTQDSDNVLTVSVVYEPSDGLLRVVDNAMGMSEEDLERALHVARPPANTSGRSKYGMGMKTAACWLGNEWTIKTKKLGDTIEHTVTVNVDRVATSQSGGVVYSSTRKPKELHYTIIEIVDMNRTFHGRTLGKIGDFLRSMYRSDLRSGILNLRWRDQLLAWDSIEDKLLVSKNGNRYKKDFEFDIDGKTVKGWVGILDRGSRAAAGFSILQANRVVRGWPDAWRPSVLYGQFQGSNDLINQRLVGEIHLDGFDVSHTKDSILWAGTQEHDVEQGIKEHCSDYRDFAKRHRRTGGRDERTPSEADTRAALDELEKELTSPEMVDQIDIAVVPDSETIRASNERILHSVVRSRTATSQGTIKSTPPISWSIFLERMSPSDPYVLSDSTSENEVTVLVNLSHPYFATQLGDADSLADYFRQCAYDSVAEWQARRKTSRIDPDTIKLLKDGLLRVALEMESHQLDSDDGA
jgi:hypothetical protein